MRTGHQIERADRAVTLLSALQNACTLWPMPCSAHLVSQLSTPFARFELALYFEFFHLKFHEIDRRGVTRLGGLLAQRAVPFAGRGGPGTLQTARTKDVAVAAAQVGDIAHDIHAYGTHKHGGLIDEQVAGVTAGRVNVQNPRTAPKPCKSNSSV